nr:MAG TPA: hypothetical protein [Crassvirales sp.]
MYKYAIFIKLVDIFSLCSLDVNRNFNLSCSCAGY